MYAAHGLFKHKSGRKEGVGGRHWYDEPHIIMLRARTPFAEHHIINAISLHIKYVQRLSVILAGRGWVSFSRTRSHLVVIGVRDAVPSPSPEDADHVSSPNTRLFPQIVLAIVPFVIPCFSHTKPPHSRGVSPRDQRSHALCHLPVELPKPLPVSISEVVLLRR